MVTYFLVPQTEVHGLHDIWFQQDSPTCHSASVTMDLLGQHFGEQLISRFGPVNWPPRSYDITHFDFFLWCYVKAKVYVDKPAMIDTLEAIIERVIREVPVTMLERVIENWCERMNHLKAS
uniref:Putative LOC100569746 [Acyrthosiphon pisum] n=1 Tax=Lepeophtheirus salmonis TaxID=72036 RepID=A0A0K2UJM4_LEPSM